MGDKLVVDVSDRIATITINNPSKRNALDIDILKQLSSIFNKLEADRDLRVVVIRGAGDKAFCAGYRIDYIDGRNESQDILEKTFFDLRASRLPIIAMLNGIVVGAGLDLCLNCDIRIAADDVKLGITPAKIGVVYHYEGVKRLAESVGVSAAKELLFTGRLITADEALRMGLVNKVAGRPELENTVYGMAGEISINSPLSIAGNKKILNSLLNFSPFTQQEKCEFSMLALEAKNSQDHSEGKKAFLEKRQPVFKGK
jgi:enoyl-CoA hydratase/carnithine racemase